MNKNKTGFVLFVMLLTAIMASAFATAALVPLDIEYVNINGDKYYSDNVAVADRIDRGEDLDISVKIVATADVQDAQIEAYISGYRYDSYERELVNQVTRPFDLENGTADKYDFSLSIPVKMDLKDAKLRIRVSNENDESFEQVYQLAIRGVEDEDALQVKSFTVTPSNYVEAGRTASFKVQVKNYGNSDIDDVYVKVAIPELGIADDETLDEIKSDETETFEELLVRVPTCAKAGAYEVIATVEFDNYESTEERMTLYVTEGGACEINTPVVTPTNNVGKTVITVPENQEVVMGTTGGVYPVMISNLGSEAQAYTLTAGGVDAWGTVRFEPGAVTIVPAESVKTVYMYVAAKEDAQAGAKVFKLTVDGKDDSKQVVLTANVVGDDAQNYDGLKRGLEIGLIILVIILIILGLIIGFNKIRGDREDEEESQTYY